MRSHRRLHALIGACVAFVLACAGPDTDGDGLADEDDCDPTNVIIFSGALEVCDAADNDCDGLIDEGFFVDGDGDGYGDEPWDCASVDSWTLKGNDCDDNNPVVSPGEDEHLYNGLDDDCDEQTPDDDVDGDGYLQVEDCNDQDAEITPDTLVTFDGNAEWPGEDLEGVNYVTGHLSLGDGVENLEGLEALCGVGGGLLVFGDDLTSFEGLGALRSVGQLQVNGTAQLSNFKGLSGLNIVTYGLELGDDSSIESLAGLDALVSLGYLWVYDDDLPSLEGLPDSTSLGGLTLLEARGFSDLRGLPPTKQMANGVVVWSSHELTSLAGLESLQSVGELRIGNNAALASLDGLESLSSASRDVSIYTTRFTNLNPLSSLMFVGGSLSVEDNSYLVDISGLSSVVSVTGDLTITDNEQLPTADAEALAAGIDSIGGDTEISGNGP